MPTIEYRCLGCDHTFRKLVFRGDEPVEAACPVCGSHRVSPEPNSEGIFDGISGFSSLAGDTN